MKNLIQKELLVIIFMKVNKNQIMKIQLIEIKKITILINIKFFKR